MSRQRPAPAVGDALASISKRVTQEQLVAYANASGDHNPLHLDPEFAAKTQFGGTIAHGMLILAFVSEMLTATFGRAWPERGRMKVRFRGPARPGDQVTATGKVIRVDGRTITCEIVCTNNAGDVLVSGEAGVDL